MPENDKHVPPNPDDPNWTAGDDIFVDEPLELVEFVDENPSQPIANAQPTGEASEEEAFNLLDFSDAAVSPQPQSEVSVVSEEEAFNLLDFSDEGDVSP